MRYVLNVSSNSALSVLPIDSVGVWGLVESGARVGNRGETIRHRRRRLHRVRHVIEVLLEHPRVLFAGHGQVHGGGRHEVTRGQPDFMINHEITWSFQERYLLVHGVVCAGSSVVLLGSFISPDKLGLVGLIRTYFIDCLDRTDDVLH